MTVIETTAELGALCRRLAQTDYVTVDTEFMREVTYWPKLCLIQLGGPDDAAAIDPLAPGMDLAPLLELLADRKVLKVFHSARQDLEIFFHLAGTVPAPLFDSQIAAMVCGFGDSVAYDTLVSRLTGAHVDKTSRFTDWARRPLTERQLQYALADVVHLRTIYDQLADRLATTGRASWLDEEMAILSAPATYRLTPVDAWQRLKPRNAKPRFLAILREVAAWREIEAQRRDIPRGRIVRDEALLEVAAHAPRNVEELARSRGLSRGFAEGKMGAGLLEAVARGVAIPAAECPVMAPPRDLPAGLGPLVELLRVLLRHKCEASHVAPKLVANTADLEAIAADDSADVPALRGWRRELFGDDALALKHGRLALTAEGKRVRLIPLAATPETVPLLQATS